MSQLAEAFVVRREDVDELVDVARPRRRMFGRARDDFEARFTALARPVAEYGWSGFYFGVLFPYLEELGVPPLDEELSREAAELSEARGTTFFLFTSAAKQHLVALDPARHDEAALTIYAADFLAVDDPDAGRALGDALSLLHEQLAALDEDSVLLLRIG